MPSAGSPALRRRTRLAVEELEPRRPPAGVEPTPVEQEYLERLNDARANPAAYGAAIGLDLSGVAPAPPLAFNTALVAVARAHAQDMATRGYFAHDTPEGVTPDQRIRSTGLKVQATAESISAGGGTSFETIFGPSGPVQQIPISFPYSPEDSLRDLIIDQGVPDLGHRRHLLAIDPSLKTQRLVGIGFAQGGGQPGNFYTIDTAAVKDKTSFATGVAFRDANGNGVYDAGEGLGGVRVQFKGKGSNRTVRTWGSGGYTVALKKGTYKVTASGGGLAVPLTHTVRVGSANVRVNFVTA
jgi:serralysin